MRRSLELRGCTVTSLHCCDSAPLLTRTAAIPSPDPGPGAANPECPSSRAPEHPNTLPWPPRSRFRSSPPLLSDRNRDLGVIRGALGSAEPWHAGHGRGSRLGQRGPDSSPPGEVRPRPAGSTLHP
jgi:hypothetical protein